MTAINPLLVQLAITILVLAVMLLVAKYEIRKYRRWIVAEDAGIGDRILGRLGILGTFVGYGSLAVVFVFLVGYLNIYGDVPAFFRPVVGFLDALLGR